MTGRRAFRRVVGVVAVVGLLAAGCGGAERAATQDGAGGRAVAQAVELDRDVVRTGGRPAVAVRRPPALGGTYGGHGVDYAPGTLPCQAS